jgi:hypothetical protein
MLDHNAVALDIVEIEEENLDDDYEEGGAKKFMHEGGEPEMAFEKRGNTS